MGLFSKRSTSKKAAAPVATPSTNSVKKDPPQTSGKDFKHSGSTKLPAEYKADYRHSSSEKLDSKPLNNGAAKIIAAQDTSAELQKRRISTVVDDSHFEDFEKDDYRDEEDEDLASDRKFKGIHDHTDSSDEDEYEEHMHLVIEREKSHTVSQLSALMGYCGLGPSENKDSLKSLADEVSQRTFSLLSGTLKIHRLSPTMRSADPHFHESVIGDRQLELLNSLKDSINRFIDTSKHHTSPYDLLENNKSLFTRYGRVRDIIGRGAYGVIRIVESSEPQKHSASTKTYAVKELQKRPPTGSKKETKDQFIDRVISEFILSSALNNKHVVRTLDLMITLPEASRATTCNLYEEARFSQVMDCTSGGNLFEYCRKSISNHEYLSVDEIDCMVKQITKGLWYIHNHGVAHCDLKLENVLLESDRDSVRSINGRKQSRFNLKLSDFGKSNVVRTKWDTHEQLSTSHVPIGSEPYMAPEEHLRSSHGISLLKKDSWALGVVILILFNIRRSFFCKVDGSECQLDVLESGEDAEAKSYGAAYLWHTTAPKPVSLGKYKDPVFGEYAKNAMSADYDEKSKDWYVRKRGKFIPLETMFGVPAHFRDPKYDGDVEDFAEGDFDLRKYCTYKLLDMNPAKRLDAGALLKSDWLASVESCGD